MRRSLSRFAWLERIPETDGTSFLTGISAASHHASAASHHASAASHRALNVCPIRGQVTVRNIWPLAVAGPTACKLCLTYQYSSGSLLVGSNLKIDQAWNKVPQTLISRP
jgi:hypothetical protein